MTLIILTTTTTLKIIIKCRKSWILSNSSLNLLNQTIFNFNYQNTFFFKYTSPNKLNHILFKKYNFKFLLFFKKNVFLLTHDRSFYNLLLHLYFTTMHVVTNGFNMFFFASPFKEMNANAINLNYFTPATFNKNFYFFFFKFNFLKNPVHAKKFLFFMYHSNVKLLFFFNLKLPPYAFSLFFNKGFFLGGLTTSKKTSLYDFPFLLDPNNIFNTYFIYLFFIKMSVYKNTSHPFLFYKNKFLVYSFFDFI